MVRSESIGDQLLAFVEYLYPHFKKPWRNYPNLEEFLSLCDVYLVFREKVTRKHAFEDAPGAGWLTSSEKGVASQSAATPSWPC